MESIVQVVISGAFVTTVLWCLGVLIKRTFFTTPEPIDYTVIEVSPQKETELEPIVPVEEGPSLTEALEMVSTLNASNGEIVDLFMSTKEVKELGELMERESLLAIANGMRAPKVKSE